MPKLTLPLLQLLLHRAKLALLWNTTRSAKRRNSSGQRLRRGKKNKSKSYQWLSCFIYNCCEWDSVITWQLETTRNMVSQELESWLCKVMWSILHPPFVWLITVEYPVNVSTTYLFRISQDVVIYPIVIVCCNSKIIFHNGSNRWGPASDHKSACSNHLWIHEMFSHWTFGWENLTKVCFWSVNSQDDYGWIFCFVSCLTLHFFIVGWDKVTPK